MLRTLRLFSIAAALSGSALATPSATPTLRKEATTHLSADVQSIHTCLAAAVQRAGGAENPAPFEQKCVTMPKDACEKALGEEAAGTTSGMRTCNWRAIGAWEKVLSESVAALRKAQSKDERVAFDLAQAAWRKFLDANVSARSAYLSGGTLADVIAGDTRARMMAERVLEVRQMLFDIHAN